MINKLKFTTHTTNALKQNDKKKIIRAIIYGRTEQKDHRRVRGRKHSLNMKQNQVFVVSFLFVNKPLPLETRYIYPLLMFKSVKIVKTITYL